MKFLQSNGKLQSLRSAEIDFCEDCVFEEYRKLSFSKIGKSLKTKKLELVHTDVWGPSTVSTLGGSRYYVTFIYDSSRKVWV